MELLVSAALTLLLTGGIVAVFLGSRTTQAANERFAQLQEAGRLALDLIALDLRGAGYSGCVARPHYVSSSVADPQLGFWSRVDAPLRGYESSNQGMWLPLGIRELMSNSPQSDVLLIRGPIANAKILRLHRNMTDDREPLFVGDSREVDWHVGQVLLAHNCNAHAYFAISDIETALVHHDLKSAGDSTGATQLNSTPLLGYAFDAGTELMPVEVKLYYIGPGSQASRSSLWRRAGRKNPEEIAPGVERMDLQFGIDHDGDDAVDIYADADKVGDWSNVRSVSISIVVGAPALSDDERVSARAADGSPPQTEESKHQIFSTVVTLRNFFGGAQ